jgi:S-adenosylmethionine synthetase
MLRLPCLQVFGEITSHADVDYDAVARQVCHDIGYNHDVSDSYIQPPSQLLHASGRLF